ncbi:MAG TPA: octaprenyl diphosphate synthase [Methylophilaceae bacterium]|nr:octaprenyl diphosphate synthase [Methylophilaceae bacterium]
MQSVNAVIGESLHSEVPLINQVSQYIVDSGGKRIRPALVLLSANLFGEIKPQHHQLAAIIEFIHTATLLHDDVVDESDMRRGKSTANHIFGNAASVLVGDFLYSRAFQMMVKLQSMHVMEILADATNTLSEGEVLQLLNVRQTDISEQDYLKVIHFKTAKLFEAATRLGAVMSDATDEQELRLAEYGMRLGTAFQLIDDVLDLSGDSTQIGKKLGNDLEEGKPTLPLLYAMQHGDTKEVALIQDAVVKGDVTQLPAILQILDATGALDYVRNVAKKETSLACAAIASFADSDQKKLLQDLADFAVNRQY